MTRHHYAWRGVDDPQRFDLAVLSYRRDEIRGHGTSTCDDYALSWSLDVGPGLVTRRLDVSVRAKGWARSLVLERHDDGRWTSEVQQSGTVTLDPPGLDPHSDFADVLDCDLEFCPVTNIMPIRRLNLLDEDHSPERISVAWVEVPSLRVLRSNQIYGSSSRDGKRVVGFADPKTLFATEFDVDANGMVFDYPELADRITG